MNTSLRNLGAALLAAVLLPSLLHAERLKAGQPFPALPADKLEGAVPDLAGKVVLVDFWASWCGPCKQSFKTMKELHAKYATQGLVIVAISVDEEKADMEAFLKKQKVEFATLRDPEGKFADAVGAYGLPMSFILDRTGKVHEIHTEFDEKKTPKKYIAAIEALLKQ